jgi:hypothetical protein
MMNEFMTPNSWIEDPVYSTITFAYLEDTGWYCADYDYATKMQWGKNEGCDFILSGCYSSDQPDEFCYNYGEYTCSPTRLYKGTCQYDGSADGCSIIHEVQGLIGDCRDAEMPFTGFRRD